MLSKTLKIHWKTGVMAILIGLIGVIAFSLLRPVFLMKEVFFNQTSKKNIEPNKFSEVAFQTTDKKGKEIKLKSEEVIESKNNTYSFNKMEASFTLANGKPCIVKSDKMQALNEEKTICDLLGHVKCYIGNDMIISTNKAHIDMNKKIINGDEGVNIIQKNSQVMGRLFNYDIEKDVLVIEKKAFGLINDSKIQAEKLIINAKESTLEAFGDIINLDIKKYNIKSKKNLIYKNQEIFSPQGADIFFKNQYGINKISSPNIQAKLEKNGTIKEIKALKSIIIKNNVIKIIANEGTLRNNRVFVTGSVLIKNTQGNVLAKKAVFNLNSDEITLNNAKGVIDSER